MTGRYRILISCKDRPGIVAAVSQKLFSIGANIVQSDQYTTDPIDGQFFMRIEFDVLNSDDGPDAVAEAFSSVAANFEMDWRLHDTKRRKRMAIFVSREGHCLHDLLLLWRLKELNVDIPLVISNHELLRQDVETFGIPFQYVPISPDNKREQEQKQLELLEGQADFVVLARYMQILTTAFLERYPNQVINIHHSFLPAFIGAKPYQQAYDRGVKIIGATAHYVTEELDQGPIIEQDVTRVNHRDDPVELASKGRDIERTVLSRAVKWHVEDRIIPFGNKTVVFA